LVITTPVEINSIPTGAEMTYRDGSLISSRGVVYVVSEGKRRQIDSPSTFVQKGYRWSNIIAVSDAELGVHPVGEILRIGDKHPNGSLLLAPDGKVYVLREGNRRWVPSPLIFEARYRWESIIAVSQEVINSYELGENEYYPDGLLIRGSGQKVYMMQNNVKQHIGSPEVFESYGLSWSQIKRATDSEINLIPELGSFSSLKKYNGGSLLGSRSDGRIYRVNNNETLEYIPSANIFSSWGYNWNDVIRLSGNVINQYNRNGTVGFADGRLILYEGKVYLIENGVKRWIPNESIFNARGYKWNNVIRVSSDEFNANSMGSQLSDIQAASIDGYTIPATSGRTAREQHLALNCNETAADHYNRAGTPLISQNGLLKTGGAFSISCPTGSINSSYASFSVEEEKYYINMRWNYVRWYEATSTLTQNISATSDRIPLASVSDYPNTGWVIINGEIIAYNGKDGNSLVVSQRGIDSPAVAASPRSHSVGNTVQEVYIYRAATETNPNIWRGRTRTALISNTSQAKNWHRGKKVLVTNPANGKKLVASIMESGPAIFTGRVSGLSPEAMLELGAVTDSNLEYGFLIDQSTPVGLLR
jgi:hypothetical protein